VIGGVLFVIALVFVWRSFYAMRIPDMESMADEDDAQASTGAATSTKSKVAKRAQDQGYCSIP